MKKFKDISLEVKIEVLVMVAVFGLLVLKFPTPFLQKFLWAEDGPIFLQGAHSGFLQSLITPYSGYLHIIPRLTAGFSLLFDLKYTPIIFLIASILVVLALVHTIFTSFDASLWKKSLVSFLIVLTPSNSSMFNNLTNIQWFGASILIIFLASEYEFSNSYKKYFFAFAVLLLGLTGPFSVLLLPILGLRGFVKRDFKRNLFFYIPFLISSFIQMWFLIHAPRVSESAHAVIGLATRLQPIWNVIVNFSIWPIVSVIIFLWVIYLSIKNLRAKKNYAIVVMLLCGLILTLCAIFSNTIPLEWSVKHGMRYSYNMYFFMLVSMVLLADRKLENIFSLLLVGLALCGFSVLYGEQINWDSQVLLYKAIPEMHVAVYPRDWSAYLKNNNKNMYKKRNYSRALNVGNKPVIMSFNSQKMCPLASDIGIVFLTSSHSRPLLFKDGHDGSTALIYSNSMSGKYNYFKALPIENSDSTFSVVFPKENGSRNYQIDVYCLGDKN